VDRDPGVDLPVAAVSRIADMGVIDNDWWIRADPVYLEARRDSLILHSWPGLSKEESDRLVAELNESLALDGWLLKAPAPERWYLKPLSSAAMTTTPLNEANGRNIHPILPQGPDQSAWHSRLTEFQILLHTSSVNAEREARGALPANSVWFWGGGQLPRVPSGGWEAVYAQDPLVLGLARLAGVPAKPLPAGSAQLMEGLGSGPHLMVFEPSSTTAARDLGKFSDNWLEPLVGAVHRGRIARLAITTDHGPEFHYLRNHRWRFWRRRRPLIAWRDQSE